MKRAASSRDERNERTITSNQNGHSMIPNEDILSTKKLVAEKCISQELCRHFTDMASFRLLRDGVVPIQQRRRCSILDEAHDEADVHVLDCATTVLSCTPCRALKGHGVLWAMSTLRVSIQHPTRTLRQSHRVVQSNTTHKETTTTLRLGSLHIVQETAYTNPQNSSFVLQSVCHPNDALRLECYPRHMLHFGLLMYYSWCIKGVASSCWGEKIGSCTPTNTASGMDLEDVSVLILGLGGNVLGNCLDTILPVKASIDVVEVEQAVLSTCQQHEQVPPLLSNRNVRDNIDDCLSNEINTHLSQHSSTDTSEGDSGDSFCIWNVNEGHERHGRYRFILADARDALRCNSPKTSNGLMQKYNLIFLDCYDTDGEHMMHDGGLIELCRNRLSPGGALIVNAHIMPTAEALREQFISKGFGTVQVLRVNGCVQSIVVCLAKHKESATSKEKHGANDDEKLGVLQAQQLAKGLNENVFRNGFSLDAKWLQSSRRLKGSYESPVRVWEHRA